jgi:hypothetical protein
MNAQKLLIAVGLVSVVLIVVLMAFSFGASRSKAERRGEPREGRMEKTEAEWKAMLTPEQYQVTRSSRRRTLPLCVLRAGTLRFENQV